MELELSAMTVASGRTSASAEGHRRRSVPRARASRRLCGWTRALWHCRKRRIHCLLLLLLNNHRVTSTLIQMVAAGGGFFIRQEREGYYVGQIGPSGDRLPTDLATLSAAGPMAGCKLFPLPLAAVVADKMRVLKTVYDWIASEFGIRGQWQRNDRGDYVLTDINRKFPITPQHLRTPIPVKVRVSGPRCKRPRPVK